MHRSTLVLILALTLIVGSTGGLSSSAQASEHGALEGFQAASKLYYPYVPNGASIDGTGPWYGSITVQNLEQDIIRVWVLPDGRFDPDAALIDSFQLFPKESRTLSAEELGIEEPGQPLVVAAVNRSVWAARESAEGLATMEAIGTLTTPKIAGTLKQAAGEPLHQGARTSEAHEIVDGYSAIPMRDIGWGSLSVDCLANQSDLINCADLEGIDNPDGVSYLPLAQTNNEWNTILHVSNVEGATDQPSTVDVELIPTGDAENDTTWSEQMQLMPGETWSIDVQAEVGEEWTGSVRIESDAGVAATAARVKANTDMLLTNTSAPSRAGAEGDSEDYQLTAPLAFADFSGWNTGFSLFNESDESNTVTVEFYDLDGDLEDVRTRTIAPNSHGIIYLPSDDDEGLEDWVGSAVLSSDFGRPFHAAVDQVNYDEGSAMSYTLGSGAADSRPGNRELGLPLLQNAGSSAETGDVSGIQLFNPDPEHSVEASMTLYDDSGASLGETSSEPIEIQLDPLESVTLHAPDMDEIPTDTVGSAVISVTSDQGQLTGVSNNVNYEVSGDGAAAFSLIGSNGLHR